MHINWLPSIFPYRFSTAIAPAESASATPFHEFIALAIF